MVIMGVRDEDEIGSLHVRIDGRRIWHRNIIPPLCGARIAGRTDKHPARRRRPDDSREIRINQNYCGSIRDSPTRCPHVFKGYCSALPG